jgi:uncharacterized integral membrane protein (TIGR00697 family)
MNVTTFKGNRLFLILGGFFITNAIIAEFVGVKIFSLEMTMGLAPVNWDIFGYTLNMELTAGVLLWPVVFIMTDVINEYYGPKGVKFLSNGVVLLISYAFLMIFLSITLSPATWWGPSKSEQGVPDMQVAFSAVFGQGLWIIVGSLAAFLIGQIIDVYIFQKIKKITGEKKIWLRATGSTLVSQLIDSFVVLYIAFGIGADWPMSKIIAIGTVNYIYKFSIAILLTPVLYWIHYRIDAYLGKELSTDLKTQAMHQNTA